jgi:putative ABC transport system permease protein
MVDLYGMRPGVQARLPLPGVAAGDATPTEGAGVAVFVAGVWRDYARQHGAIVMARTDYERLTGDGRMSDVSLWMAPDVPPRQAIQAIVDADPTLSALDWRSAADIRALSLRIFDRSFAVTYALEAIALLVALFGVAAASAGDALVRAREFGMLRHVGVATRRIAMQLGIEAALGVTVAVAWGGIIGAAIGIVLIHRVNPQSFHWTMDVHWPTGLLLASAAVLVVAAVLAALIAVRHATGPGPLRATREDW